MVLRRLQQCFYMLCCVAMLSNCAHADDSVVVIVNKQSPLETLTVLQLRNLYLGESRYSPQGEKLTVINQRQLTSAKQQFFAQIIQKKPSHYHAYWARLLFTGKALPPREVANSQEVIDYVAKHKEALGYSDSALLDDRVKVIYSLPKE